MEDAVKVGESRGTAVKVDDEDGEYDQICILTQIKLLNNINKL